MTRTFGGQSTKDYRYTNILDNILSKTIRKDTKFNSYLAKNEKKDNRFFFLSLTSTVIIMIDFICLPPFNVKQATSKCVYVIEEHSAFDVIANHHEDTLHTHIPCVSTWIK